MINFKEKISFWSNVLVERWNGKNQCNSTLDKVQVSILNGGDKTILYHASYYWMANYKLSEGTRCLWFALPRKPLTSVFQLTTHWIDQRPLYDHIQISYSACVKTLTRGSTSFFFFFCLEFNFEIFGVFCTSAKSYQFCPSSQVFVQVFSVVDLPKLLITIMAFSHAAKSTNMIF